MQSQVDSSCVWTGFCFQPKGLVMSASPIQAPTVLSHLSPQNTPLIHLQHWPPKYAWPYLHPISSHKSLQGLATTFGTISGFQGMTSQAPSLPGSPASSLVTSTHISMLPKMGQYPWCFWNLYFSAFLMPASGWLLRTRLRIPPSKSSLTPHTPLF